MIRTTQVAQAEALVEAVYKGPCERSKDESFRNKGRCLDIEKVRTAGGFGLMNHRKMCDSCAAYWLVCQAALLLKDIALKEKAT